MARQMEFQFKSKMFEQKNRIKILISFQSSKRLEMATEFKKERQCGCFSPFPEDDKISALSEAENGLPVQVEIWPIEL